MNNPCFPVKSMFFILALPCSTFLLYKFKLAISFIKSLILGIRTPHGRSLQQAPPKLLLDILIGAYIVTVTFYGAEK